MPEEENMYKIESALKSKRVIVFLVPSSSYIRSIGKFMGTAARLNERLCYVSLSRPYKSLCSYFQKNGIDTKRIFFVDAATRNPEETGEDEQVVFVSSPKALTELGITLSKVVDAGSVQCVIFDSISALLVYEDESTVLRFVHSVISSLAEKTSAVFILLKDRTGEELLKDLSMFADEVIGIDS